jgi:hypothetical protein
MMKLIPHWRRAWRMLSVQLSAVIVAWVALPEAQQVALAGLVGIAPDAVPGVLAALAILGRVVDQPALHPERQP